MIAHVDISVKAFQKMVKQGIITLAGNKSLKIFGKLNCSSGKRMKKENRVFFAAGQEAINHGFRPCGHCMKQDYTNWKEGKKWVE